MLTIGLSLNQTLRQIYAATAVNAFMRRNDAVREFLTPDNREALVATAIGAICETTLRLMDYVVDANIPDFFVEGAEMIPTINGSTNGVLNALDHLVDKDNLVVENGSSDQIVTLTLQPAGIENTNLLRLLRKAIETSIADRILSIILADIDPGQSEAFTRRADNNIANIKELLSIPHPDLRITPY